ncbi:MAG: hypothetical protein B6244_08515 [Candidatus Cloacimonetes bacterium 4572_55]|nr:MAG: hypothetical protein B6244_08515 [Candidatus Cloacimonetes bacterium 4572_55]
MAKSRSDMQARYPPFFLVEFWNKSLELDTAIGNNAISALRHQEISTEYAIFSELSDIFITYYIATN